MPDLTINQQINVPDGCYAMTRVIPLKHLTDMPYVRSFVDGLVTLALDKDLTGQDIRVFLVCVAEMEFENILDKTQGDLAAIAGMKQQHIGLSLKKLLAKDYLRVIGHKGRQNIYRINPSLVVKTRAKNVMGLIREWNEGESGESEAS